MKYLFKCVVTIYYFPKPHIWRFMTYPASKLPTTSAYFTSFKQTFETQKRGKCWREIVCDKGFIKRNMQACSVQLFKRVGVLEYWEKSLTYPYSHPVSSENSDLTPSALAQGDFPDQKFWMHYISPDTSSHLKAVFGYPFTIMERCTRILISGLEFGKSKHILNKPGPDWIRSTVLFKFLLQNQNQNFQISFYSGI